MKHTEPPLEAEPFVTPALRPDQSAALGAALRSWEGEVYLAARVAAIRTRLAAADQQAGHNLLPLSDPKGK